MARFQHSHDCKCSPTLTSPPDLKRHTFTPFCFRLTLSAQSLLQLVFVHASVWSCACGIRVFGVGLWSSASRLWAVPRPLPPSCCGFETNPRGETPLSRPAPGMHNQHLPSSRHSEPALRCHLLMDNEIKIYGRRISALIHRGKAGKMLLLSRQPSLFQIH